MGASFAWGKEGREKGKAARYICAERRQTVRRSDF